jgi:transposase
MAIKNQSDYTDEFREQIVKLAKSGKPAPDIAKEYDISKTSVYSWIRKYDTSGSFRNKDNLSSQEQELIGLRKENKRLKMEVDLKQAALIMARK